LTFEKEATHGRAVFIESNLADAICGFRPTEGSAFRRKTIQAIQGRLRVGLRRAGIPRELCAYLQVEEIDLIVFKNGQISLVAEIKIASGWSNEILYSAFNHDCINTVTKPFCNYIGRLYDNFKYFIDKKTKTKGRFRFLSQKPDRTTKVNVQSLHILFAGTPDTRNMSHLSEEYRNLLYPSTLDEVKNQTTRKDRFVFLGYAFSYVFSNTPRKDAREYGILIRIAHCLFGGLGSICADVEETLEGNAKLRISEIARLSNRIKIEYHNLLSPVFAYRHEFLLIRDKLFKEWLIERTQSYADYLVSALHARELEQRERIEKRGDRLLNWTLLALAFLSLIGVVVDLHSIGWLTLFGHK